MEVKVRQRLIVALALALVFAATPLSAHPRKEKSDSLVRLMKAESIQQLMLHGQQHRKAVASTFLHNGTYLISDTALWNVETKVIKARGHVKVIQDETVLTSDKLDYFIDDDLAQFSGTLVQLQNKKKNTLRTRYLDYNTRDSVAVFRNGASMRDEKGQIIESLSGSYRSKDKMFTFQDNVNMFSDSVFVKTDRLFYYSDAERAVFPDYIDFWKGGNMLSAREGWYDRMIETFFFTRDVHGLTQDQEMWSDSLYYYQNTGNILLAGKAQIQDPSRKVTAVADRIFYDDTLSQVMLRRRAAVTMETTHKERTDTIYMGADTLIYRTIRRCDIPEGTVKACETRLADILTDAVTEFRRKAAEAAAKAAEEASKTLGDTTPQGGGQKSGGRGGKGMKGGAPGGAGASEGSEGAVEEPEKAAEPEAPAKEPASADPDSLKKQLTAPLDSAVAAIDRLVGADRPEGDLDMEAPADSLKAPADTLKALADTLKASADTVGVPVDTAAPAAPADSMPALLPTADSLGVPADSTAAADTVKVEPPKDTTELGFMYGIRNVRIFRNDIQIRCDSMAYCDLDSIARFYLDPVVWNEGNRQYTSDSLFVLVGQGGPRKASLQSNAFVITQQDTICYDQIKGAEVMAYFDTLDNSLSRFDALGGASALFFIEEGGVLATVNKVESKMLSGLIKDNNIDQVYYFEQPKNNAYPVVQLPESEKRMKGFEWRPDERPKTPADITTIPIRRSLRDDYLSRPRAKFTQTEIYFPGYMPRIRREIAIRDSLAKIPKPEPRKPVLTDSLSLNDSIPKLDSLALVNAADSLAVLDSLARDVVAQDSLAVTQPRDTTAKATPDEDPLAVATVDPKQKRKEELEQKRKLRQAARDARIAERERRWAELDKQDSLKAVAKQQKLLEKERAKKLRQLLAIQKQERKDSIKLQRYIEKYRKQYEREQKRKAARERAPGVESGGEVPAPAQPEEQPGGGDAILRDDGSADDHPVLGGSRLSGA